MLNASMAPASCRLALTDIQKVITRACQLINAAVSFVNNAQMNQKRNCVQRMIALKPVRMKVKSIAVAAASIRISVRHIAAQTRIVSLTFVVRKQLKAGKMVYVIMAHAKQRNVSPDIMYSTANVKQTTTTTAVIMTNRVQPVVSKAA